MAAKQEHLCRRHRNNPIVNVPLKPQKLAHQGRLDHQVSQASMDFQDQKHRPANQDEWVNQSLKW